MARKDSKQANFRKSWMSERNYHQIRNKDGHTVTYIITVEGQDIEVTKEIYRVYSKADRRERYLLEQDSDHGVMSYSDLDNNHRISFKMYSNMADDSLEESVVRQVMCKKLYHSLGMLPQSEREFIICRYWKGMTQAALAERLGISQQMISYREKQILRKLKIIFSKF